jgi:hypothetical protein
MDKRTLKRLTITAFVMLSLASIVFSPWIFIGELVGLLGYMVWVLTDSID